MSKRHYIIYTDESDKRGKYYSNFFGGVILRSSDQQEINFRLNEKKFDLGLNHEAKWQFVDRSNVDRYIDFVKLYFEFIATSRLKARIMFTQNMRVPIGLERRHHDQQYFLLYYQFIKHAFGIAHCNPNLIDRLYFRILPDKIPDSAQKIEVFKNYLCRIPNSRLLRHKKIYIPKEQISDVDSKKHVILQGLDLILGAMCAKLNDKLYEKPPGQRIRGKRTRAKEKLYKAINREIREIYPNFNVGVGTGCANGPSDRWSHPYRHWLFMPRAYKLNRDLGKN
ncbi:hypothetical protein IWQ54_002899 [Labrenzia sp. EL_195]|nr:hypothetical protein [Labrenzia sp. EL_195]